MFDFENLWRTLRELKLFPFFMYIYDVCAVRVLTYYYYPYTKTTVTKMLLRRAHPNRNTTDTFLEEVLMRPCLCVFVVLISSYYSK